MRILSVIILLTWSVFDLIGQHTIQGIVTNERGEKLSFATVFIQDSPYAASTDEKGYYSIKNVPAGHYRLKATFIGYRAFVTEMDIAENIIFNIQLKGDIYNLDQIEIHSNRVKDNGPFTYHNMNKATLQKENLGQDVPFMLQWSPSMVVTSDAGTGIGYTGLRLRGSDQTRINVTLNGVPVNDAESQNVFWVDLPDLMGSVKNIQIQRGVGTSTNGAGAFGGTVSINTGDIRVNPYVDLAATIGSFNTLKRSVNLGTGLINDRYMIDARYSLIDSDGFVDRATADLQSFYFSATRITGKSSLRFNVLSGDEKTYQAWYGVPEAKVYGDKDALLTHYYNNLGSVYKTPADSVNLFSSGRNYNYYTYPGQIDNYRQTHLQLIHALSVNPDLKTKFTYFYTKGKGFYEEFKPNENLEKYNIPAFLDNEGNLIQMTDIVRRRWLDNDLLGVLADVDYKWTDKLQLQSGFSVNYYFGNHFGQVLKSTPAIPNLSKTKKYYENNGEKSDMSVYLRAISTIVDKWTFHADLQFRNVNYTVKGIENDLQNVEVDYSAIFVNPKIGVNFDVAKGKNMYFSYAVANKEPSRSDFIDYNFGKLPESENLQNMELGYKSKTASTSFETNLYYMFYKNQLVLTGELNDVGAPLRINVPRSYRLGLECSVTHQLNSWFALSSNISLSKNKIAAFEEVIPDYTTSFEKVKIQHTDTDISFSPATLATFQLLFVPFSNWETELSTKFVGKQFLDNTGNDLRSLPAYHFQNWRLSWKPKIKFASYLNLTLLVNNILDVKYSSNGYTYSYKYGQLITENYLYPQAGRNILLGVNLGF